MKKTIYTLVSETENNGVTNSVAYLELTECQSAMLALLRKDIEDDTISEEWKKSTLKSISQKDFMSGLDGLTEFAPDNILTIGIDFAVYYGNNDTCRYTIFNNEVEMPVVRYAETAVGAKVYSFKSKNGVVSSTTAVSAEPKETATNGKYDEETIRKVVEYILSLREVAKNNGITDLSFIEDFVFGRRNGNPSNSVLEFVKFADKFNNKNTLFVEVFKAQVYTSVCKVFHADYLTADEVCFINDKISSYGYGELIAIYKGETSVIKTTRAKIDTAFIKETGRDLFPANGYKWERTIGSSSKPTDESRVFPSRKECLDSMYRNASETLKCFLLDCVSDYTDETYDAVTKSAISLTKFGLVLNGNGHEEERYTIAKIW